MHGRQEVGEGGQSVVPRLHGVTRRNNPAGWHGAVGIYFGSLASKPFTHHVSRLPHLANHAVQHRSASNRSTTTGIKSTAGGDATASRAEAPTINPPVSERRCGTASQRSTTHRSARRTRTMIPEPTTTLRCAGAAVAQRRSGAASPRTVARCHFPPPTPVGSPLLLCEVAVYADLVGRKRPGARPAAVPVAAPAPAPREARRYVEGGAARRMTLEAGKRRGFDGGGFSGRHNEPGLLAMTSGL